MNTRERFLSVMRDFDSSVPTMKWEFGYWGETINNWYREGLPKQQPAVIPSQYTTISSSVYTKSWTCNNIFVAPGEYPKGYAIMGGGLYYPTQGFALDEDVRSHFKMDISQRLVDANLFFYPMFEPITIEEDDYRLKYRDVDGATRVFLKESATMASGWEWPVKDRATWEELKHTRLQLDQIRKRLPENWNQLISEYRHRDYPLGLGGYPLGFFGTLAHLIGYDHLFFMYYDDPELIHDILNTFTNLWIAVFEEILTDIEIDHVQIWEDISFGSGSMVSKDVIREFMLPYYKRLTGFLKEHGVKLIFVDTDGDCMDIIPLFIEGGVTGMLPFEVNCGMDIVKVRQNFPELAIMGGIPKSQIGGGKLQIDRLLEPVKAVLKTGGYIPYADHFIPPDVHLDDFAYYRARLNDLIDA